MLLVAALPAGVAAFLLGATAFALTGVVLAAAVFFTTDFVDFAAVAFLAAVGVFAGFFIAFAIGSTTKWVMPRNVAALSGKQILRMQLRLIAPRKVNCFLLSIFHCIHAVLTNVRR
ncbi:MAG TPA: hypothetical protein VI140_07875 [Oxalicibacterium sp.]